MVELVQSGSEVSLRSTFAKEAAFQVCLRAFALQRETGFLTETQNVNVEDFFGFRQRGPNRNQPTIVLLPAIIS